MKRLGPILVILFGAVLAFGGLSSSPVSVGAGPPTCSPNVNPGVVIAVEATLPPCVPCSNLLTGLGATVDSIPCDPCLRPAGANIVVQPDPCVPPCDSIPFFNGTQVPCETTTTIAATTTVAPTTTEFSGSGANLPATGSRGISVTLVIGVALMTLGVVLLLVRRRSPSAPIS